MGALAYPDDVIRKILTSVRTIAVVGASPNPSRPSFHVARFLSECGYHVFAVNPGHAGGNIASLPTFAKLRDIPHGIDMVDVFRASEHVAQIVDETLALSPRPKVIWTQLGVRNDAAAARAEALGMTVIMDRCPAIEAARLGL